MVMRKAEKMEKKTVAMMAEPSGKLRVEQMVMRKADLTVAQKVSC